jgi:hypothetical protein
LNPLSAPASNHTVKPWPLSHVKKSSVASRTDAGPCSHKKHTLLLPGQLYQKMEFMK